MTKMACPRRALRKAAPSLKLPNGRPFAEVLNNVKENLEWPHPFPEVKRGRVDSEETVGWWLEGLHTPSGVSDAREIWGCTLAAF